MKKKLYLFLVFFVFMSIIKANAHEIPMFNNFSISNVEDYDHVKSDITLLDSNIVIYDTTCVGNPYIENGFNIPLSALLIAGDYNFAYTLTNQNGFDSTVTLMLTVLPRPTSNVTQIINENQIPYSFNNLVFNTGVTNYPFTITRPNQCDSMINFTLHVNWNVITHLRDTICQNFLPYAWNGATFTSAGIQNLIYPASNGADSIVIMTLTVLPVATSNIILTITENQLPYTFNGLTFTNEVFDYMIIINRPNICDSLITFTLHINWNVVTHISDTICQNSLPYYFNSVLFNNAGTQNVILPSYTGADSTLIMTLVVNYNSTSIISQTINENQLPYLFNGETFLGEVQDFPFLINNYHGCDSLITYSLHVNWNIINHYFDTICQHNLPYIWNGVTFTSAITQNLLYTASNGADSVVIMTLVVYNDTFSTISETITENQLPYTFNGQTFTNEVVNNLITISNSNGCDSIISYSLQVNWNTYASVDTTVCINSLPLVWRGFTFNQAGSVIDTFVNTNSSQHFITYTLHVDSLSSILFSGYVNPVCPTIVSQSIMATVPLGAPPFIYSWSGDSILSSSNNQVLVKIAPASCNSARNIYLQIEDQLGCIVRDTVVLQISSLQSPTLSATIPSQNGSVTNCQFSVPNLVSLVRSYSLDQCYPSDSLTITQSPAAGTIITSATNVTMTISNPCGNSVQTTVSITVPTPLSVAISNIVHVLCYGQSTGGATAIASNGTASYGYSWSTQATPSTIISSTSSISGVAAGTYRVTVTDASGCTATATVTIQNQTNVMNAGTLGSDQTICYGQLPAIITGTSASGGNNSYYVWQSSLNNASFTNASGINNTQNYSPSSLNQNTYYRRAWISTACGTVYSDTLLITIFPVFRDTIQDVVCQGYEYISNGFNLPEDSTQYIGENFFTNHYFSQNNCDSIIVLNLNVLLNVIEEFDAISCNLYTWNDETYSESGDYVQDFSAFNGCDSTVTLHLVINPTEITNILDTICQGGIYIENGFIFAPPETNVIQTLEDELILTNMNSCDSIVSLSLTIIDTTIQVEQLTADFCQNFSTQLIVNGNFNNYLWSSGETTQIITVNNSGTYTVTASNTYCERTKSYVIAPCTTAIYIPNSFSPNGDGINDYFGLSTMNLEQIVTFKIVIYNRWGQKVYESYDPSFKWDGKSNQEMGLRNNIYSYVIEYRMQNEGSKFITGTVTVL